MAKSGTDGKSRTRGGKSRRRYNGSTIAENMGSHRQVEHPEVKVKARIASNDEHHSSNSISFSKKHAVHWRIRAIRERVP